MNIRMLIFAVLAALIWNNGAAQIAINAPNSTVNPIKITDLTIKVRIVGNIATTNFEMTVANTSQRMLEGELTLPLHGDQDICRYALDVNGKLREGVPVEKIKARQTFEAIVRRGVDPGLVQKTKGNIFKTRIYPIAPNGKRTVAVAITETLAAKDGKLYYSLPLEGIDTVGHFAIDVAVLKGSATQKPSNDSSFSNINFDSQENTYNLSFKKENYKPEKSISFTVPQLNSTSEQLFTTVYEGKTFFYLYTQTPVLTQKPKPTPKAIAIYWDNSFSASKRAVEKELELLNIYLSRLKGEKQVMVYTFNHQLSAPKKFVVGENVQPLLTYLKTVKNGSATRFDNLSFESKADEILLFSDGINTISGDEVTLPAIPVYTFLSSAGCNTSLLKHIANRTNGEAIDLLKQSANEAVIPLLSSNERFIGVSYDRTKMQDVYPSLPQAVNGAISLSGILLDSSAMLTIKYGDKKGVTQSQNVSITANAPADPSVVRLWAKMKIAELDSRYEQHKDEIAELGKKFGIVTRNTSFLVLENVSDYVQYGIDPPAELRAEYDRIAASRPKPGSDGSEYVDKQNAQYVELLSSWYNKKIINPNLKPSKKRRHGKDRQAERSATLQDDLAATEVVAEPVEAVQEEEPVYSVVDQPQNNNQKLEEVVVVSNTSLPKSGLIGSVDNLSAAPANSKSEKQEAIELQPWLPDAPYLRVLRETADSRLDSAYYALREKNSDRPAFFIEVSDLFFKKGMKAMGVQVLLSILEIDAENPELLKVSAHRLMQEGEYAAAILIYEEVKKLRPEEPQSYRDLALAYEQDKRYQEALNLHCYIMSKNWGRFDIIKEVTLNEMNSLIARHRKELNLSIVEKSYIMPMAEDVRIVMDWSSNDNDIDLWVDDPNKERCMYSHKRTEAGGKISSDFTGGYGPEEYAIKKAIPGEYKVYTNYYADRRQSLAGPVTIYLTLYTYYGTTRQTQKRIALQLKESRENTCIGSITFKP